MYTMQTHRETTQVYVTDVDELNLKKNKIQLSKSVTYVYNGNILEKHPIRCNRCIQDVYVEKKISGIL